MKNAHLLTLLSVAVCSATFSSWQFFALDQRVSIKLPHQPHLVEASDLPKWAPANRVKVWRLFTKGGDYELTRTVYSAANFAARDTIYYTQLIGLLKKAGAHNIALRRFAVAGAEGREITYYTTYSTPTYMRCFALDSVRYAAVFFPARQLEVSNPIIVKLRNEFFNSIKVSN